MAGHSKFKNIQYRKGAQDKKRAKQFAKIGREIQIAVKIGGTDPESNPRLRLAITNARSVNMPKDNVCLLYTSPSPRDSSKSRMPSSA